MKQVFLFFAIFFSAYTTLAQDTYKLGNTEYYIGQYYSTTGKPKVKRSAANVRAFLGQYGYSSVPYGYEVDHIIPLSQGGSDDPNNMQLLTVEQHARKTAAERAKVANSTSSYPLNYSIPTPPSYDLNDYKLPSTLFEAPIFNYNSPSLSTPSYTPSSTGRVIQTGPRGGKYYINSNGNKTYVK